jgi:hypothetical protein
MDFSDVRVLEPGISLQVRAARRKTIEAARSWVREFIQSAFEGHAALLLTGSAAKHREARISLY